MQFITLTNEPGEIRTAIFPPPLPLIVACHLWVLGTDDPVVVGSRLRVTFWLLLHGREDHDEPAAEA